MRFQVGQQFKKREKRDRVWTVVDIFTTYDSKGHQVKVRYVAETAGELNTITDYDVVETTIAMGEVKAIPA